MHVGIIINKLRKEKRMTLLDLSRKSGVALATLSRIENGRMTGTLDSHMNIANALEIPLPDLYTNLAYLKKQVEVKTKKTTADVFIHNKNVASEMLISKVTNKKMLPLLIKLNKGGATRKEEAKIGVEKFIYLLEGKIEAIVGEEKYNVAKGDTLYFESSLPHYFKNIGPGEAHLICVISPPTL